MKKVIRIFSLLILPALFFILCSVCKTSKGEFYLSNYYDPSYVYLINSLNLAQLNSYGVGHIDHPGTTAQVIGAVAIYFTHLFSNNDNDVVTDVFNRPEYYLSTIYFIFILLNSSALFILGFVSFKKLKSIYPALFLQLTPFFSVNIYFWIVNVAPEPLLIFSVLILITIIVSFTSVEDWNNKSVIMYILAFSLVCGFGLATKISFFPLLIIPIVLLKKFSFKILFCFITFISFLIFVFPAMSGSHNYYFFKWIRKLIFQNSSGSLSGKNVFNFSNFLENLGVVFSEEPVFGYSYILITIAFIIILIPRFREKLKLNRYCNLLIGIFAAMTIQIFIACRNFALSFDTHYLLPAYLLFALGLFAVNSTASDLFPKLIKTKLILLFLLVIMFSVIQINIFLRYTSYISQKRDASDSIIKYVEENYNKKIKVSSYGVSNKQYALYIGALFGGSQKNNYYSILKKMFPDDYYYEKWSKNFENVDSENVVKDILINAGKFIFLCDNETVLNDFVKILNNKGITSKKIFSNTIGETIYVLSIEY